MFNINFNGVVNVSRGDSFEIPVKIVVRNKMDKVDYEVKNTDLIYLGVMEPNQPFETALIRKKCTIEDMDENGNIVFSFTPEDTQCVLPGRYYYQVKLQTFNEDGSYNVYTVVDKTLFFIVE